MLDEEGGELAEAALVGDAAHAGCGCELACGLLAFRALGGTGEEEDVVIAGELSETFRERIVHPEPALEVDLAGRVAALQENLDCLLRRLA